MEYVAIIISLVALVAAGFAFIRAQSSHGILAKRIEALREKNNALDAQLRKLNGNAGRGNRPAANTPEPRQKQPRQEQQEPRQKQPKPEQQPEQRQKQRERQPRQEQGAELEQQQEQVPQQQRRKKENRRRNEPMEKNKYDEIGNEQQATPSPKPVRLEIVESDFLTDLEQQAAVKNEPVEPVYAGKKYAVIPEDGFIRAHQLQQQPDSDSYIEVDAPAEGSNVTNYRFNLSGNHAFVISQGIDRLENAFAFEKPSNRMVSRVVLQGDGVLTKVNNGWKIQDKARIDFR